MARLDGWRRAIAVVSASGSVYIVEGVVFGGLSRLRLRLDDTLWCWGRMGWSMMRSRWLLWAMG